MKLLLPIVIVMLLPMQARAAETIAPVPDQETKEFSRYGYETNYYNGLFHGVHDYCQAKVDKFLLDSSLDSWTKNNGAYINAADDAIVKFVARRVEKSDATRVTKALQAQNLATFQKTRENNVLLKSIKESKDEPTACSYNLGVLVSHSFYFQKIAPKSYQYWVDNLKP